MRPLTQADRLQALSLPEIAARVRDLVHRLGKKGGDYQVNGARPRPTHVLNAIVLDFLARGEGEQDRAYLAATRRLEMLMEVEEGDEGRIEAILAGGVAPGEGRGHEGGIYPVTPLENVFPTAKKKGRKKSGNGGEGA